MQLKKKLKQKKHKQDKKEVDLLKAQLARALADYENFRKRVDRQNEGQQEAVTARVIGNLLPVFDMLFEAQSNLKDAGLALTIAELKDTLNNLNIEEIKAPEGSDFNEELHEVLDTIETEEKENKNKIAEVMLTGWKFKSGQVIRHAKVKVYK